MPRGYKDDDPEEGFEGTDHNVLCLDCGHEGPPKVKEGNDTCAKCGSTDVEEIE